MPIVAARRELGGNLLVLGEHQLELALQHDGFVRALVFDARGKRVVDPGSLTIGLTLTTEDGRKLELALPYDREQGCFWSKPSPGAALSSSVIPVTLGVGGGNIINGTLSQYALLPAPRFGGQLLALGGFGVELVVTPERVRAQVLDSWGKPVTRTDLDLKLSLGAGGELALGWDIASMSYQVALDGKLDPTTQPLRLALSADGRQQVAATQSLRALADGCATPGAARSNHD